MSLSSSFTKLVGSLSSWRSRIPRSAWAHATVIGFMAVSATGCGGCDNNSLVCNANGLNCTICDGYGCRPANGGVGGSGGASPVTTSATGTGGAGGGSAASGGGSSQGGAGGAAPCDATQSTCPCVAGKCSDGKQCVQGLCIDGCNFSYECGAGKVCAGGACVAGCDTTKPCDAGFTCTSGACVLDPKNPACSATKPCPSGEVCASGLCTTACSANAQCAAGEICDGASHACVSDPSPKPICDTTKPCPAPQVCQADGYCHYPCTAMSQCKLIDNRFVACDQGVCKTTEEVDPECTLDKPCPAGKTCISNACK